MSSITAMFSFDLFSAGWELLSGKWCYSARVDGHSKAFLRAVKAKIVKAIFRGAVAEASEGEDEPMPKKKSRSKKPRATTVQPDGVGVDDEDDPASQSPLVAKYYNPKEPCPDGMDERHWLLPPNYPFPKIVEDYNVAYVYENYPSLPIWQRKKRESPRDCLDRQFRLILHCLIRTFTSPFHLSYLTNST
jgi:hypothetical protein